MLEREEGVGGSVDNGKASGVLLAYLSKAFDCLGHELLIAKLNTYSFTLLVLKLIYGDLSNRKQWKKLNSFYIILGIP